VLNPLLRFERDGIFQGEVWRLITGHFVHLGVYHGLMNAVGLVFIHQVFSSSLPNGRFCYSVLFISLFISVGLLLLSPAMAWYLGFSGVLHGLFVLGVLLQLDRHFSLYWLVLLGIVVKLVYEQLPGYNTHYLDAYIHAPVAVQAHLYGAVGGGIVGLYKLYTYSLTGKKFPVSE